MHAPCQRPISTDIKRHHVDDHHPSPSSNYHRVRLKAHKVPFKMALLTLPDTCTSWDLHVIRAVPGQCVPDGPPAEIDKTHWTISAFFGFDAAFVGERFLHRVSFGLFPLTFAVAHWRSPLSGSGYNIRLQFLTWLFIFLLSLIVACCPVFVKARLQACVADCFHIRWGLFLPLLLCMLCFCALFTPFLEVASCFPNSTKEARYARQTETTSLLQPTASQGNLRACLLSAIHFLSPLDQKHHVYGLD